MSHPYFIETVEPSTDYELLDSGDGDKLERYGSIVVARPDPQALWKKQHPEIWKKAQAVFTREGKNGGWKFFGTVPERWGINFAGLGFYIKPTSFKHTGLFPEQATNWSWMQSLIQKRVSSGLERPMVLNLFGYTGGATLACAKAGADVCHVDGSKTAIGWGRDNAALSGLVEKPIRWILDDAVAFVRREIKRGRKYDGIVLDPPAFGHGPDGEMWKIENDFVPLLDMCFELLSDRALFFLINGYASGYSAVAYGNNLFALQKKQGGRIETGELTIRETDGGRLLPCGIFARWQSV